MARRKTDAVTAAFKWQTSMQAAGDAIQKGVDAVTEAPGPKAAKQKANWLARVTAAADKWAKRVGAVSLAKWQDAMKNKGIPRIAGGTEQGMLNYQAWLSGYLPMIQSVVQGLGPKTKGNIGNAMSRIQKVLEATQKYAQNFEKKSG